MKPLTVPMTTAPMAALFCAASLVLPNVHAQQGDVARWQFTEDLKAKAEKGDPEAQSNLGACYGHGAGVTKDYAEAVKWYRKAAEQNYASAQNNLGSCYLKGNGVAKDVAEALKLYRRAAEQHCAPAQANLAHCYDEGIGVTKDEMEAVRWLRKAAEGNYAESQLCLGTESESPSRETGRSS